MSETTDVPDESGGRRHDGRPRGRRARARHHPAVGRAVLPRASRPQDRSSVSADDVAQEVCLAVLTALPGYRVPGSSVPRVRVRHRGAQGDRRAPGRHPQPVGARRRRSRCDRGRGRSRATRAASRAHRRDGPLLDSYPDKQREILLLRVVVDCPRRRPRKRSAPHRARCGSRNTGRWPGCASRCPRGGGGLSARTTTTVTATALQAPRGRAVDLAAVQADDELINALGAVSA